MLRDKIGSATREWDQVLVIYDIKFLSTDNSIDPEVRELIIPPRLLRKI
ncbi:hypothetical protein [Paenibacillus sedimenti]|uniref:Uncharacterized protein n=1 Tax=Paenibacillus sedimenti TaxID=2770274 RepID=A0A926QNJ2_9BACL|nr:hypothetical protein [Paenibacillus sedimenti]MBD0384852.1 hypothetical protein [Paenibacillus sedimenti]